MESTESYLQILIDSLEKKEDILNRIIDKNTAQYECLKGRDYSDVDWDRFNLLVSEKDVLINRLLELDEGFAEVYERINKEVTVNKELYRVQISRLQELIGRLTDKGATIETGEERNRQIIDGIFAKARQEIKKQRTSVSVASSYYKTMSNSVVRAAEDSILDEKK